MGVCHATFLPMPSSGSLALNLHEVQHNGLDESGVLSKYSTLRQVEEDIKELAQRTTEFAEVLKQRLNP